MTLSIGLLKVFASASIASLQMYNVLKEEGAVGDVYLGKTFSNIEEGAPHLSIDKLRAAAEALRQFIAAAHHGKHADDAAETYAKVLRTIRHLEAFKQKEKENE